MFKGKDYNFTPFFKIGCILLFFAIFLVVQARHIYAQNAADTIISISPTSTTLGENVSFSASVTDTTLGGSTPTGTVTYMDGSNEIGSSTLSETTPTVNENYPLTPPSIPSGLKVTCGTSCPILDWGVYSFWIFSYIDNRTSYEIVAYDSSGNIVRQWEQTGDRYMSDITVDSSAKTITFLGQAGNLAVGWTSFNNANSQTSFSTTTLSVGEHAITAVYSGDSNHTGSTSSVVTHTVNKAATTAALTSATNPSSYLGSVTYTATVSSSAGGTASGTVTFMDGDVSIGTETLSSGVATFSTTALSTGSHSLTAVYAGDSNYATSTSSVLSQTVNQAATTVELTSSSSTSTYSGEVTLTATVSSIAGGTATGTVTFMDGSESIGTGTLTNGIATLATTVLLAGSHDITAVYVGDNNYATSTSSVLSQTVNQAATTVALKASTNPSMYLSNVTFTAMVSASAGGTASGTVTFMDGDISIGTATLTVGEATYSTKMLSAGTHNITAVYAGDSNYISNSSESISQLVLDIDLLDMNNDHEIHIDDILKILFNGTDLGKDFNHDGIYDNKDLILMLHFISPVVI
ncbi:MAG: hypothetical protein JWM44_2197 [Bacilli bacterium]|nr:hypothetical protein [Bacilli bacterium]